jgi:hypothetical protein
LKQKVDAEQARINGQIQIGLSSHRPVGLHRSDRSADFPSAFCHVVI